MSLPCSMADFVPCDRLLQKAYCSQNLRKVLHDPVKWYGINHAGTQITQWTFKTKKSQAGLVRVPLFWKFHYVICVPP